MPVRGISPAGFPALFMNIHFNIHFSSVKMHNLTGYM